MKLGGGVAVRKLLTCCLTLALRMIKCYVRQIKQKVCTPFSFFGQWMGIYVHPPFSSWSPFYSFPFVNYIIIPSIKFGRVRKKTVPLLCLLLQSSRASKSMVKVIICLLLSILCWGGFICGVNIIRAGPSPASLYAQQVYKKSF